MRTRWRRGAAFASPWPQIGCRRSRAHSTRRVLGCRPPVRRTTRRTRRSSSARCRPSSSSWRTTRRPRADCSSRFLAIADRRSKPSSRGRDCSSRASAWPSTAWASASSSGLYSGVVDTTAESLSRARRPALSLPAFRRLAWASVAMLVIIVATGATVRLTGWGLGCEHWPGCEQHHFEPRSFHSYIEFGNRVVAFFTFLATLAAFIGAVRARLSGRLRALALVVFLGTLAQAPLGAITIHFHLNPWLVLSHFLLSVVVLTLGVALAVEVSARPSVLVPGWARYLSVLVWISGAVLIVSGTLATAAGPHPGSTVVRRLWSFQPAVYWHVRATAVFGI